ncbi:MlaD family protein [Humisphaera borealis]|uniref:MCE family protein n=1 Tax=Humisphaera borealis TaxID=2807512 RepID=A0A7M2X0S8_9BACT|nr:MlaD family protein [Humisphaera borealis]QOV91348.1 MCE family protein [Humisphaera borealis]
MTSRSRNILVGSVVLVAILSLGWMILKFSGSSVAALISKGETIQITTERADGVSDGSAVYYLGVPVGQATGVKLLPDNSGVVIDALISADKTVPANVIGRIKAASSLSMSAGIFLETVGPPSDKRLAAGAQIKAINQNTGLIPPEFTDLARSIREQQLIAHVDETVIEMRNQLRNAGVAIDSFNKIVGDPKVREDLSAAIASIRTTSENLQKFTAKLETLSGETSQTLSQVRTTLSDGGKRVDELTTQVGSRLTQVGELLDKFNAIATRIDKGEGTAGALVNDPRLYESLVDTSKTLNLTIADLRRLVEQWEQEGFTLKLK